MTHPLITRRQQTPAASGLLHPPFVGVIDRLLDGAIIETVDVDVVESGGSVKLQLQADGGGDLSCRFAGQTYRLDCTPVLEVTLTAGTDVNPTLNYVYITESAGVLTLTKDTSGWPATSHCPIATVLVQSAASVATDGAYKVHVWTDHFYNTSENGHLSHINKKLRQQASWVSGVTPSDLVVSSPDAYISTTAGVVFQLHEHTMPAIDMQTPAPVFLLNDPTTAYKRITTFDDITQDASGGGINNKYMNLVLWGVVSANASECKLFINLPTDTYTVEAQATADEAQTTVYSLPDAFAGTAFLIARYTVQAKDSGAWSQSQKVDLRGLIPSSSPGGGGIPDLSPYLLIDGTRAMTGNLDMGTNAITNVGNVDGRDVSADGAIVDIALTAAAVITDHALVRGDGGARGTQGSPVIVSDAGAMSGITKLTVDDLEIDGNVISAVGANNDIRLAPKGADGEVEIFLEGAVTDTRDILEISNSGWAAGMTDTRSAIAFRHAYTSGGALDYSARIVVGTEDDWTGTVSTRDAYMAFFTALNGSVNEQMRITSDGRLGINTTNPTGLGSSHIYLGAHKDGNYMNFAMSVASSANAAHRPTLYLVRARGTEASKTAVSNAGPDTLGMVLSGGYDGSAYKFAALMKFVVDGAVSANTVPTAITFETGAPSRVERFRFQSDGDMLMDSGSSFLVRDAALGFNSSVDGQLDLFADVELEITAPTVDLTAATAVFVRSTNGINYSPGADVNCDLITVDVTGAPKLWWYEALDSFSLTRGFFLSTTLQMKFRDSALNISSSVDGQLDIAADVELEITAPTVDLTAATAVIVRNVHGINYAPGSDTDTDLITVNVTGAPTIKWDESEDVFASTHGLLFAGTSKLFFLDSALYLQSPFDGQLNVTADVKILCTAATTQFIGAVQITGSNGINYNPGIDSDVDIATVDVAGAPKFWWDESKDSFDMSKGLILPGLTLPVANISGATTLTSSYTTVLCDASGGAFTVTLPAVSGNAGLSYSIKKTDASANAVTIDGDGAETIDDAATRVLAAQYDSVDIVCDGAEWWIVGR